MGLSSVGITLFLLPFCVSPRPQNLVNKTSELRMEKASDLEAKAPEVSLGMGQAFDLEMVEDDSRAKLNSVRRKLKEHQQGGLVQSMALTCPPPVASFLRYFFFKTPTITNQLTMNIYPSIDHSVISLLLQISVNLLITPA